MRWYWLVPLAWLCGCDDIRLSNFLEPRPTLSRKEVVPPGEHCAHGGQVAYAGEDLDGDGLLAEDEVTRAEYLCTPQALSRTRTELAGVHCELGGRAVETGVDTNANGTLEDDEVDAVEYVCATPFPGVLVRMRNEPSGTTCPQGGQVTHAGLDTNGDGVLQTDEITREVVGCMEPAQVLSRLESLGIIAGGDCGERPVYAVESGPDEDGDGTLDDDEVRATRRLCASTSALLWRQVDEPGGLHCVSGGVSVVSGSDTNQDGALQENEVLATAYVCHPSATHDGDYEVRTPSDLAALQGISHIRGDLLISSPGIQALSLPGLESVEGHLRIRGNPQLDHVALTGLRFVREDLSITENGLLVMVVTDANRALHVGGSLRVERNMLLRWLGLNSIVPRRDFHLTSNASLVEVGPLPFMDALTGELVIEDNRALTGVLIPKLLRVGTHLTIQGNVALRSLEGLKGLQSVGGDFTLAENGVLPGVAGLASLERVGGDVLVWDNAALTRFTLPLLRSVGSLSFLENPALTTIGPLVGLMDTGHAFSLFLNDNLDTLTGLTQLRALNGTLSIHGNPKLDSLMAFEPLESLTYLQVTENRALPSLAGLHNLRTLDTLSVRENPALTTLGLQQLRQVRGAFAVLNNDRLPQCAATALADSVFTGPEDERSVQGNDTTAVCTPP
ncbi:hypothetical protein MFUL124B02_38605 [Myxococcus fulvus 124B02]|nr:hypothetical protein MFUL124B02_38605 [Myxococcus fulvus 124B02]